MHGITRILMFCLVITVLPTILLVVPLYLRHILYASVAYTVAESDIMEIDDGISTIFCSEQTLKMDTPFNAFKVLQPPEITTSRKHIRLKKSMTLPDDTIEYWGIYLLKGATVALSFCSRFKGASILVVKGERSLQTCGIMEPNENRKQFNRNHKSMSKQQVKVTFPSNAQEKNSPQITTLETIKPWIYQNNRLMLTKKNLAVLNASVSANDYESRSSAIKKTNQSIYNNHPETADIVKSKVSNVIDHRLEISKDSMSRRAEKISNTSNMITNLSPKFRHVRKKLYTTNPQRVDRNNTNNKNNYDHKIEKSMRAQNFDNTRAESNEGPNDEQKLITERMKQILELEQELKSDPQQVDDDNEYGNRYSRLRRSQNGIEPPLLLDRGIEHGGNALYPINIEDSSDSSFENELLTCYNDQILLAQQFESSDSCTNISLLVNGDLKLTPVQQDIQESGYYYYVFYSDHDDVPNDVHVVFDIQKPTFRYKNVTQSCVNTTECSFSIGFLSEDRVIVEIPTRNGIGNQKENITILTSTCDPRMGIYTIFPITVLLLVLGCAFL